MKRSQESTKVCKICFKKITFAAFLDLFHQEMYLCPHCQNDLKPVFQSFETATYQCMNIYNYDEKIKSLLYQLKGCFDIELAPIFLYRYTYELRMMFYNYTLIPAPSYFKDDEKRGFNHVIEIFKCLKLPIIPAIKKNQHYKQSDHSGNERKDIYKVLEYDDKYKISGLNILIVDDVYTTGSTIKSMIRIIEQYNPKNIKVLVMSKTCSTN